MTDFNVLVEAELERHARQWEKTQDRLEAQIEKQLGRIRELEVRTAVRIEDVPWLVKDFNVLYRCAKQALDAAQRDGFVNAELVALQVHVTRLESAFTDTEEVRKAAR